MRNNTDIALFFLSCQHKISFLLITLKSEKILQIPHGTSYFAIKSDGYITEMTFYTESWSIIVLQH